MKHLILTVLCTTGQAGDYAQDFYHDFRDRPLPRGVTKLPFKTEFISIQPEGALFAFPKDRKNLGQAGLSVTFVVKGNFEITAGYEILHAEAPADGWGVGMTLVIEKGEPSRDRAGLYRFVRAKGEQIMVWDRSINVPDKKREGKGGKAPCTASIFRMRMSRLDGKLTYAWAPGTTGEDFHELETCEFGSDDIHAVVLNGTTGFKPARLDARVLDLRIRSGSKSDPAPAPPPVAASALQRPQRRLWWLLSAVSVALILCVALLARRRRQKPTAEPQASAGDKGTVEAQCPKCQKRVRVTASLAGKKVKCPGCATVFDIESRS